MPEGIVPELLLVLAFLVVLAVSVVVGRRQRGPREDATRPSEAPRPTTDVIAEPRPTEIAPVPEPAVEPVAPVERPGLRARLERSRRFLTDRLAAVLAGGPGEETWDDIEATLIQADLGVEVAAKVAADLRAAAKTARVKTAADIQGLLADDLQSAFDTSRERTLTFAPAGPTVWLVMGVNGTGKTTTIGKLAHDLKERGRSVALAAADTFRAAADEQLGIWATRADAEIVKHQPGADPGAVAFDAYQHAHAQAIDVLIIDTAGRLHTKTPLMDELAKVRRVIEKEGAVHEALLVIDATSGQNGLTQAREFTRAAQVTGIVLTKLDGTAKGGIALAIERDLGIPIKLIGVGEGIDDLEPFEPKAFVDALLS
ncbi:MAG: signal recognition particle-docking protein FtsY [Actinomycetota bacterium]|nr:signal recognition particle-docking protein FtsY [Actinomycetota bacterium]